MTQKPVIGIAGGIGSGKSTVARMLGALGCVVAHSDDHAREVLREPAVRDTIVAWWGRTMLDAGGAIDRRAVGRVVFADPEARRRLEALTHPRIEARRRALFESAPDDAPALVVDAPLLFETGLADACDAVIFVAAPLAARRDRTRAARGWDEHELARREEIQVPLDEKRSRADYVVENDGDLSGVEAQVQAILKTIIKLRRA